MDWKDQLRQLAESTPLPEGDADMDTTENTSDSPIEGKPQNLEIILERKGRGGKTATIVAGFTMSDNDLRAVLSTIQKKIGAGGSARGGELLFQGDRRAQVAALLRSMGHRVKGNLGN